MTRWLDPHPVTVSDDLRNFIGGYPLVAETLVRRGMATVDAARAFLDPDAYTPAPPTDLPGLSQAVDRVMEAIQRKERICVWGDFDVDGQTATTLLVATLRDLGSDVIYHIPLRETESHGVKVPWLQKELEKEARLIVTCDTGIDACEAVNYANAHGVDVIITDHHELPATLPDAYAIVNSHLLPAGHPLETLPGVGVAYKLAEELYRSSGCADGVAKYLDLVALGIVADVAVQTGDTRYLLQRGLEALRSTPRLGLQELLRLADINPLQITEDHIGFSLGPRLNALGRLDDATPIVEFFTTTDLSRARILASQFEALNARRKMLCDQVFAAAQAEIEKDPSLLDYAALVLANPRWPAGVIGIVANRLAERYHRPAILIATPSDGPGRGSARSVAGCHITDAIATQQALLLSFGGHEMAAGLAIEPNHIPAFRQGLSQAIIAQTGEAVLESTLQIDSYLPLADLSLELLVDIARLAPFGPGNPPLRLATRNLELVGHRPLGRDNRHMLLTASDEEGTARQVVWWYWDGAPLPEGRFDLAYTLRINDFRGQRQLQIVWEDMREVVSLELPPPPLSQRLEIIDYRRELHPITLLKPLMEHDNVQVWCEGVGIDVSGRNRYELRSASELVIWTLPPGPDELKMVLDRVSPAKLYLFQTMPGLENLDQFLKHLVGLIKYALLKHNGRIQISTFAAMMAHREITVRSGLAWLEVRGYIRVLSEEGDVLHIDNGEQKSIGPIEQVTEQLQALLDETAAYRAHFARVNEADLWTFVVGAGDECPVLAP